MKTPDIQRPELSVACRILRLSPEEAVLAEGLAARRRLGDAVYQGATVYVSLAALRSAVRGGAVVEPQAVRRRSEVYV
jgi:hypothetical protein